MPYAIEQSLAGTAIYVQYLKETVVAVGAYFPVMQTAS